MPSFHEEVTISCDLTKVYSFYQKQMREIGSGLFDALTKEEKAAISAEASRFHQTDPERVSDFMDRSGGDFATYYALKIARGFEKHIHDALLAKPFTVVVMGDVNRHGDGEPYYITIDAIRVGNSDRIGSCDIPSQLDTALCAAVLELLLERHQEAQKAAAIADAELEADLEHDDVSEAA